MEYSPRQTISWTIKQTSAYVKQLQSCRTDHNGTKLEINNLKKTGKSLDIWKLNNSLPKYMDQRGSLKRY